MTNFEYLTDSDKTIDTGIAHLLDDEVHSLEGDFEKLNEVNDRFEYGRVSELKQCLVAQESILETIKRKMFISYERLANIFSNLFEHYKYISAKLTGKKNTIATIWNEKIKNRINEIDSSRLASYKLRNVLGLSTLQQVMQVNTVVCPIVSNFEKIVSEKYTDGDILPADIKKALNEFNNIGIKIHEANKTDVTTYKVKVYSDTIGNMSYSTSNINQLFNQFIAHVRTMEKLYVLHKAVNKWNNYISYLNNKMSGHVTEEEKAIYKIKLCRIHVILKIIDNMFIIEKDIMNTIHSLYVATEKCLMVTAQESIDIRNNVDMINKGLIQKINDNWVNWSKNYDAFNYNKVLNDFLKWDTVYQGCKTDRLKEFKLKESRPNNLYKYEDLIKVPSILRSIFHNLSMLTKEKNPNEIVLYKNNEKQIEQVLTLFGELGINVYGTDGIEDAPMLEYYQHTVVTNDQMRDLNYNNKNISSLKNSTTALLRFANVDNFRKCTHDIMSNLSRLKNYETDNINDLINIQSSIKEQGKFLTLLATFKMAMETYEQSYAQVMSIYEDVNMYNTTVEKMSIDYTRIPYGVISLGQ